MGLPILASDVRCLGSESNFIECNYLTDGHHASCDHSRDAGVECVKGELTCELCEASYNTYVRVLQSSIVVVITLPGSMRPWTSEE